MSELKPCWTILSYLRSHPERFEALWEPSWPILDALTARGTPPPGPGEGVGGGVKFSSSPASRLAHSHPLSQHTSSTRDSACSAAVFGWTATGNQNRPHVRDAGARCPTRARWARRPWGPSVPGTPGAPDGPRAPRAPSVPHAPAAPGVPCAGGARSVCQVRPRT